MLINRVPDILQRSGGRRIFVSSNCQAGPISMVLRILLPNDEICVGGQPIGNEEDNTIQAFADQLAGADVWVRYGNVGQLLARLSIAARADGMPAINIPHINFSAFHPDLFYAFSAPGILVHPHYQSGIVVWAYRNRIEAADIPRLFTAETFDSLGYLSRWEASVALLKQHFVGFGLDFNQFFWRVKRTGVFMHSVNHPKAATLVTFAKCIALRLGASPETWNWPLEITDHDADGVQWPVYPEIAYSLGLPGVYDWVERGTHYDLPKFINKSYALFLNSGIQAESLELNTSAEIRSRFDHVLNDRLKCLS